MTDERPTEGESAPGSGSTTPPPPDEAPASPSMSEAVPPPAAPPPVVPPPIAPPIAPPPQAPPPPPLAPYVSPGPAPALGAQPAVAWAAPTATVTQGGRTTLSAVAGVMLLVLGVLGGLLALLVLAVAGMVGSFASGGYFDEVPGMPAGFEAILGGIIVIVAVVMLVYTVLAIAGGIGVLRSRGWGRVVGIVVGVIGVLFWLLAVFSPSSSNDTGGIVFAFVLLALHLYITIVLIGYWRNRAPA